jgi:hemerythrin superfamily protein
MTLGMQPHEPVATRTLPSGPVSDALSAHHREIEDACLAIMSAAFADEPRDLTLRWRVIERELLAHMATEEQQLLPAFARAEPEIAQALRVEHDRLREMAFELGVAIQLHAVRAEQLQAFVDALRAHAGREELSLYPWARAHLEPDHRRRALALHADR